MEMVIIMPNKPISFAPEYTQTSTQGPLSCDDLAYSEFVDCTIEGVEVIDMADDKRYRKRISISLVEIQKPYVPCVTEAKKLVMVFGVDHSLWKGRVMRLYVNPDVTVGGAGVGLVKVGGIQIKAVSGIEKRMTGFMTGARGKRVAWYIDPLPIKQGAKVLAAKEDHFEKVYALFLAAENEEMLNKAKEAGKALTDEQKRGLATVFREAEKRIIEGGAPCENSGILVTGKWCASGCTEAECPRKGK